MYHETHQEPFYCPTTTQTWQLVLEQDTHYDVKVVRTLGRFWENCHLYINGIPKDCDLKWHPLTPFCSDDGIFSWQEKQYNFMLLLRGPLLTQPCGRVYLFINGFEVHTNAEFSLFWKNQGQKMVVFGLLLFSFSSILAFLLMTISDGYMHFDEVVLLHIPFLIIGLLYLIAGICTCFKYRNARADVQGASVNWSHRISFV